MFVPVACWLSRRNCVLNLWDEIYLLLMNITVNDVVVLIEIYGKSLNYRGDSVQNFNYVLFIIIFIKF